MENFSRKNTVLVDAFRKALIASWGGW